MSYKYLQQLLNKNILKIGKNKMFEGARFQMVCSVFEGTVELGPTTGSEIRRY
jgi:hypothetical protein